MKAAELRDRFEQGDKTVELSRVMVEMQKARVSFEAVKQVRNQLVTAYQEIMSMNGIEDKGPNQNIQQGYR